jgi:threonine aldolase
MTPRSFLSDNASGVHPAILQAITDANTGHAGAYGADTWTRDLEKRIGEHFGPHARAFPVFNGTGANVAAIAATTHPHQAVICAAGAHLDVDECGAPERIAGVKLITVAPDHGKLTPDLLADGVDWTRIGDEHSSQPALLSISNATEVGTVYTAAETSALADFAHSRDLLLHIDGARLANAAAHLDTSLAALTTQVGADIVSFGGTKNGLLFGEAVIFGRPELAAGFEFVRKQTTQLASKMRFISAQLDALLTNNLWLENARSANAMAARLAGALTAVGGIELVHPVEANGVFARMPGGAIHELEYSVRGHRNFHIWDPRARVVRLMCSWDTTEEDVDAFAERVSWAAATVVSSHYPDQA